MKRREFIRNSCVAYPLLAMPQVQARVVPERWQQDDLLINEQQRVIALGKELALYLGKFGRRVVLERRGQLKELTVSHQLPGRPDSWPNYMAAALHNDQIYILDRAHHCVDVFSTATRFLYRIPLPDSVLIPMDIGFMGDKLWLLDSAAQGVWQYRPDTGFEHFIAGLSAPLAATTSDSHLHILESGSLQISVWDSSGHLLYRYGQGEITDGHRVMATSNNKVVVLDRYQQNLLMFLHGQPIHSRQLNTASSLKYLTVTADGTLLVTV
ncbi:hypothetical protein [Bacterioplanoides pacificum]|uniref:Uncharacterized protein n=1 Tax=Bacterioplanoides pacificum TaxID=1171596 RepID=A0ABV7VYN4_9GAMM